MLIKNKLWNITQFRISLFNKHFVIMYCWSLDENSPYCQNLADTILIIANVTDTFPLAGLVIIMVKTVGVKVQFPARRRDTSISTNKTFAVRCERDKIIRVLRERYSIRLGHLKKKTYQWFIARNGFYRLYQERLLISNRFKTCKRILTIITV